MLNFDFIFISSHDISSVKNYSNNKLYLYIVLIYHNMFYFYFYYEKALYIYKNGFSLYKIILY